MKRLFLMLCFSFFLSSMADASNELIPRIHFESNRSEINSSEVTLLEQNVEWMKSNPKVVLILEGHCDEFGESSYNLQLGDLRAREVKAFLMDHGVDPERVIMVVSYGEEHPLDTRPIAEAYRANRRVEFVLR